MRTRNGRPPRRLAAGGVAAAVLVWLALVAVSAHADPVTHGTDETVTFSDDTLSPGQTFTITVDLNLPYSIDSSNVGSFTLQNLSKWTFNGCTVLAGPLKDCDLMPLGTDTVTSFIAYGSALPANTQSTVRFDFTVANDASGTIAYAGRLYGPTPANPVSYSGVLTIVSNADVAVTLDAAAPLLAGSYIDYTITVANNGPATLTTATIVTTVPSQTTSVTNLGSGCTYNGTTQQVTCTVGPISLSGSVQKSFRANLGLLSIGSLTATATRTTSTPSDPNTANDTDTAACTVITGLIIIC